MKKILAAIFASVIVLTGVNLNALAEDGINVNITEGQTLSAEFEFIASGGNNISMSVDGKAIGAGIGKPYLCFSAAGLDYGGGNVYYGEKQLTELPSTSGTFKMQFDTELLSEGETVLTYIAASNEFTYPNLPVYGTYNLDDQNVTDVSVILPNGKSVSPASVILYYPVEGTNQVTEVKEEYDSSKSYSIGDGWNASTNLGGSTPDTPIYAAFVFKDLLNEIRDGAGSVALFDTAVLSDGEHTLSVTYDGGKKDITFFTDNTGPVISLDLAFGTSLFKDSVIEFSAQDPSGKASIKADIDGEFYRSGASLEWVSFGKKLLTVTATDAYGNTSTVCTEFRMCKNGESVDESLEKQTVTPVLSGNSAEYVYNIGKADGFVFEYLGTTTENGSVSVSVYDYDASCYVEIGVAEKDVKTTFSVNEKRFISDGEVKISVKPNIYVSRSDTVVWVTDTQYYSNFEDLNSVYELILNYSVDLYKENNAGYLIHTGDIVDTYSPAEKAASEWKFADKVHEILDNAGMPNGVLAGNHDTNNTPADFTYFNRYFGAGRFNQNLWYGGSLDKNTCHYDLLTIAGTDYLFMYLSNGAEDSERTVAWANAVCKAYPQRTVIICVHSYLDVTGDYVYNPQAPDTYNHSRAHEIMEYIIKPNENVAAVLCGHVHGACRVQRDLGNGRYLWEILSDYQYAETGDAPNHVANGSTLDGEGYIRLVTFGTEGKMSQTTYSPLHDDYNYFDEEKDTFEVTLQTGKANVMVATESAAIYFTPADSFPVVYVVIALLAVACVILTVLLVYKFKRKD